MSAQTSTGVMQAQADKVLSGINKEGAKIEKSAKDFESLLLSNWLSEAENSFAKMPGSDEEDEDPGKEQFMGMAMQSLGTSLTAAGGIGLAKMIANQLHTTADAEAAKASKS
jgi:Rod binding domain-containing protein